MNHHMAEDDVLSDDTYSGRVVTPEVMLLFVQAVPHARDKELLCGLPWLVSNVT
jgi:hypothetical protein